ncbi:putative Ig domain-containing protein (plasmid) [Methylomonas sp. HW2-6]|uniref:putative Ig domain-containing protein n=1 Tax=Methylomonas sp. HW2-6 TaxID=3376687 RepID=UPI00404372D5
MRQWMIPILWLSAAVSTSTRAVTTEDARLKGIAWLISSQNSDGGWHGTPGLEVADTAAAIEALINAGVTNGETFAAGVAWLQNHRAASTDTLARQIIALARAGRDTSALVTQLLAWRNDEASPARTWGAYDHYGTSFPDTALALEAIKTSGIPYAQEGYTVCSIVGRRNGDGGWPYFLPPGNGEAQASRVLATAYNLIVLNRYRNDTCGATALATVLSNGVAWLKTKQKLPGGGFGEGAFATVPETVAAYRALTVVLGTDAAVVDAQNFLMGQQQSDGSWGAHDALSTTTILTALPAVVLADTDKDGLPDGVETPTLLGTNPNIADSKILAKGNGMSVSGLTTFASLIPATLNQPYSTTLNGNGGVSPNTWSIITGKLPDGLALNGSTGEISGTPTTRGAFNFVYQVASADRQTSVTSQINVTVPVQVPELPHWAMATMTSLLLFIAVSIKNRWTKLNTYQPGS